MIYTFTQFNEKKLNWFQKILTSGKDKDIAIEIYNSLDNKLDINENVERHNDNGQYHETRIKITNYCFIIDSFNICIKDVDTFSLSSLMGSIPDSTNSIYLYLNDNEINCNNYILKKILKKVKDIVQNKNKIQLDNSDNDVSDYDKKDFRIARNL